MTVQRLIEYYFQVLTFEPDNKDYVEFSSDRNFILINLL